MEWIRVTISDDRVYRQLRYCLTTNPTAQSKSVQRLKSGRDGRNSFGSVREIPSSVCAIGVHNHRHLTVAKRCGRRVERVAGLRTLP